MITLKGWNDFYEGWLAGCVGLSRDESRGEAWCLGWSTADETPGSIAVLPEEIRLGHVLVEEHSK